MSATDHPHNELVDELLALAVEMASGAAALVSEGRRRGVGTVATKSTGTDMVTEYDRASEHFIVSMLDSARPNDAVIGEEQTARAGTSGISWLVDPIDGTTNFLYGLPFYSVSIAAADHLGPLIGVVAVPAVAEMFVAARGRGATCNGETISCSTTSALDQALVATGFGYQPERRAEQARVVAELIADVRDIRRMGAASVDLCSVACGRIDVYYERDLGPWDVAAGELIAREAGARTGNFTDGSAGPAETLAASPKVFEAFRHRLDRAIRDAAG